MANPNGNPQNLLKGGQEGNRGGGRIPSEVRKLCKEGFADGVQDIINILKNKQDGVSPGEQIRAFEALGKYGMGELSSVAIENGEWLKEVAKLTSDYFAEKGLTPGDFETWWSRVVDSLNLQA